MNRRLVAGMIALAAAATVPAAAETPVSGIITTDTTWTVANSPYRLTGDLAVEGATLTIESGVEVEFHAWTDALVIGAQSSANLVATDSTFGVYSPYGTVLVMEHGAISLTRCDLHRTELHANVNRAQHVQLEDCSLWELELFGTVNSDVAVGSADDGVEVHLRDVTVSSGRTLTLSANSEVSARSMVITDSGRFVCEPGSTLRLLDHVVIGVAAHDPATFVATDATVFGQYSNANLQFEANAGGSITGCIIGRSDIWLRIGSNGVELDNNQWTDGAQPAVHGAVVGAAVRLEPLIPGQPHVGWYDASIETGGHLTVSGGTTLDPYSGLTISGGTLVVEPGATLDGYDIEIGSASEPGLLYAEDATLSAFTISFGPTGSGYLRSCDIDSYRVRIHIDNADPPELVGNHYSRAEWIRLWGALSSTDLTTDISLGELPIALDSVTVDGRTLTVSTDSEITVFNDLDVVNGGLLLVEPQSQIDVSRSSELRIAPDGTGGAINAHSATILGDGHLGFYDAGEGELLGCIIGVDLGWPIDRSQPPVLTGSTAAPGLEAITLTGSVSTRDVVLAPNDLGVPFSWLSPSITDGYSLTLDSGSSLRVGYGTNLTIPSGSELILRPDARLEMASYRTLAIQGGLSVHGATLDGGATLRFYPASNGTVESSTVAMQPVVPIVGNWPELVNNSFVGIDRIRLEGEFSSDTVLNRFTPLPLAWSGEITSLGDVTVMPPTRLMFETGTMIASSGQVIVAGGELLVDDGATIEVHGPLQVEPGGRLTVPRTAALDVDGALTAANADLVGGGTLHLKGGTFSATDCELGLRPLINLTEGPELFETPGSHWNEIEDITLYGRTDGNDVTLGLTQLPYGWSGGQINGGTMTVVEGVTLRLNDTTQIRGDGLLQLQPGSELHVALPGASLAVGRPGEAGTLNAAGATITGEPGTSLWVDRRGAVSLFNSRLELQPRVHIDADIDLSGSDILGVEWLQLEGTPSGDQTVDATVQLPLRWQGGTLPVGSTLTVTENVILQLTGDLAVEGAAFVAEPGSVLILDGADIRAGLAGPGAVIDLDRATIVRRGWGSTIAAWDGATVTIDHTTLADVPLQVGGAAATVTNSVIARGDTGISAGAGSTVTVSSSDLSGHDVAAIDASGSADVDARGCWWTAADGPSGDAGGSGDPISGPVLWDPPATTPQRHEPLAPAFLASPSIAFTGQATVLTDASSGAPTTWSWRLGDGSTAEGPAVVHSYSQPGTYLVELTVSNPLGTASTQGEVSVVDADSPAATLLDPPEVIWLAEPANPNVNEMVTFTARGADQQHELRWDLDGDGDWDSYQRSPRTAYHQAGVIQVAVEISGPTGTGRHAAPLVIAPADTDSGPWLSCLDRQYPESTLAPLPGQTLPELWTATVVWPQPGGFVSFELNGDLLAIVGGDQPQVSQQLDLTALPVQPAPSTVTTTSFDSSGAPVSSASRSAWVLPHPSWLADAVADNPDSLQLTTGDGELVHRIRVPIPDTTLSGTVTVPDEVPFFAGELGVQSLTAQLDATVSSLGPGTFSIVDGQAVATIAGHPHPSPIHGHGVMTLFPATGLRLKHGGIAATFSNEEPTQAPWSSAEPGVTDLGALPVVGPAVARSATHTEVSARLDLSGEVLANLNQDDGGAITVQPLAPPLTAAVAGREIGRVASDHLSATVTVSGTATMDTGSTDGGLSVQLDTRSALTVDHLFQLIPATNTTLSCTTAAGQPTAHCSSDTSSGSASSLVARNSDRAEWGVLDRAGNGNAVAISNVFPGASPVAVSTSAATVVLWVGHDSTLPATQSTGILWSTQTGDQAWSEPQLIAEDTRLELHPVAAATANGSVVAAWLRVHDPALATTVDDLSELPMLLAELDVVTASFDPSTGVWSTPQPLTSNAVWDGSLRLARSDDGNDLVLAWLRSSAAQLVPTSGAPGELLVSRWNGGSWQQPTVAASNLAGVTDLAVAATGDRIWVLLAVDPVASTAGDERLELLEHDGATWSMPAQLVPGEHGPRQPRLTTVTTAGDTSVLAAWVASGQLRLSPALDPDPVTIADIGNGLGELWLAGGDRPLALWQRSSTVFLLDAGDPAATPVRMADGQGLTFSSDSVSGSVATWLQTAPTTNRHDLHITTLVLGPDLVPVTADTNAEEQLQVVVANHGTEPCVSWEVAVLDAHNDVVASQWIGGPMPSGDERHLLMTGSFQYGPLTVVLDPANDVAESDEDNNELGLIERVNTPPQASAVANPTVGPAPLKVTVDASRSRDADGDTLTYRWFLPATDLPVTGPKLTHTFTEPGRWPVTLVVTDPNGALDTLWFQVTVLPTDGQVNDDGVVDVADLLAIIEHLFARPHPYADVNGSGTVDAGDLSSELRLIVAAH